ncbi:MAG: hypothetical protein AB7P04_11085 [Bacteriovoracia bacterium]
MPKAIQLAFVVLLAGAAGFYLGGRQLPPPPAEPASQADGLREKIREISDHEIDRLGQIQNLEERARKAEEILGKMMLILLADLGLRANPGQQQWMQNLSQGAAPAAPTSSTPTARPTTPLASPPAPTAALPNPSLSPAVPPPLDATWLKSEAGLAHVETAQDAEGFLHRVRIRDFANQLSQSTMAADRDPRIGGCWEGDAQLPRGPEREWHVKVDLFLNAQGTNSTGNSVVELFRNGRSFSRASINGRLKNLRRLPGSTTSLVLEASNRIYFQLYYLAEQDYFIGNVYRKSDVSQYDYYGVLTLFRRKPCP